jgi:hypothetical protein
MCFKILKIDTYTIEFLKCFISLLILKTNFHTKRYNGFVWFYIF